MPTREELEASNAAVRAVLDAGAEAKLRAIPGVRHVSVGLKRRAGVASDQLCIRVYVEEKRALADIRESERIPPAFNGFETDVHARCTFDFASVDTTRYRPIQPGSLIANNIFGKNKKGEVGIEGGSLGCMAKQGRLTVLLSCNHVLKAHGGDDEDRIYQPAEVSFDPPTEADIGRTLDVDDNRIGKVLTGIMNEDADAAIARISCSKCCDCCCVDYVNVINGLSRRGNSGIEDDDLPASNAIVDMRPAVSGARVFIVGAYTGRSEGWIEDANGDTIAIPFDGHATTFINSIYISTRSALQSFSQAGDSGSLIIDEHNYVVGLLFASSNDAPEYYTLANHIEHVCSGLDITINFSKATTPTSGARREWRVPHLPSEHTERELLAIARKRVLAHPAGAWLWEVAELHREEIMELVTTHRPVSVAWQRAAGPAFVATALNAIRAGRFEFPMTVNGVTLEDALARMGVALEAHGSPELRDAIRSNRDSILGAAHASASLEDLLDKVRDAMAMS
jgi:hypothetical protein